MNAGGRHFPARRLLAPAAIALAGLAAYSDSLGGPFVFDDPSSITSNQTIRHLSRWLTVLRGPNANVSAEGRPIVNLSLAVNWAISGPAVWSYHLFNVAVHVTAGLVLFGLARRLALRCAPLAEAATAFAFSVALVWTVHPLQTEAVTYVIQRSESLAGLFFLATLYGFARYCEGAHRRFAAAAVAACWLGAATKEILVVAPPTVLLLDRTFFAGSFREAVRRRGWLHAALFSSWALTAWFLTWSGGTRGGSIGFGVGEGIGAYWLTQFKAVAHYLRLCFWPHPLIFDYGTLEVTHPLAVLPQAVLVAGLGVLSVWALWRKPAAGFLGWWFFAILAPTSLVPGTTQMIVEHRMYLPLAAVVATAFLGGAIAVRGRPFPLVAGASVLALALAVVTWRRNRDYSDGEGLWSKTVALSPDSVLARTMYGVVLDQDNKDREAARQLEAAIAINPNFYLAQENLGELLFKFGQTDDAIGHYRKALSIWPGYFDALQGLGIALAKKHEFGAAVAALERAVQLKPDDATAHYNLADVLDQAGRRSEATGDYREAIRLDPDMAAAHFNLANDLADLGRREEAVAEYAEAIRLRRVYPQAEYNLGNTCVALGRLPEAVEHFRAAVREAPSFADARNNLGSALFQEGRLPEAAQQYEEVLREHPDWNDTRALLAAVKQRLESR